MKKQGIWKLLAGLGIVIVLLIAVLFSVRFKKRGKSLTEAGSCRCTLTIRCDTILSNMDRLDPEKISLVPADGVLLPVTEVGFEPGESVFDILYKAVRAKNMHMEFSDSALYGSVYIEGIGNLYEFDCGDLSGWMYSVNGEFPMYGMSQYYPEDRAVIEILYTCNLGRDLGNSFDREE